jgi:hypothetical protein
MRLRDGMRQVLGLHLRLPIEPELVLNYEPRASPGDRACPPEPRRAASGLAAGVLFVASVGTPGDSPPGSAAGHGPSSNADELLSKGGELSSAAI